MGYGIALDLGTSGYRTHLVDLKQNGRIISTAITMRHPLPGANIMDHLHFWLENGSEVGHGIIAETVDRLISLHNVSPNEIERMGICGNPAQLSMFENVEVRDLAYAGQSLLKRLNVDVPSRRAHTVSAEELDIKSVRPDAEVRIPPSIRHEIGADALAMIMKSHLLDKKETCMVTDYGTNAEMGLFHDGELYTGSAAAGPAMEGQSIDFGMLAAPQAISDVVVEPDGSWTNKVLDQGLDARIGDVVDPIGGEVKFRSGVKARGITGTGVVAVVASGLETGIIKLPHIISPDKKIHLQDRVLISEHDIMEAGKAMGAIRAGHKTLIEEVGISDQDVQTMYLAGASGTYVDPIKAQTVGLVPRTIGKTVQIGNTSLMMAYDLLTQDDGMDRMQATADSIASKHIMFATSRIFEDLYVNEIGYWLEGMPMDRFNSLLKKNGYQPMPEIRRPKATLRVVNRDIPVIGHLGLKTLEDIGVYLLKEFQGCHGCKKCMGACLERALRVEKTGEGHFRVRIATEFCLGTACKKCESICPENVFKFSDLEIVKRTDSQ